MRLTHDSSRRRGPVEARLESHGHGRAVSAPSAPAVRTAAQREHELRLAISTLSSGRVLLRYFASPHDLEGTVVQLCPREAEATAFALTTTGFHVIARNDEPDRQLRLAL